MLIWEADQAQERRCRMWKRLGGMFERAAYERAGTGNGLDRIAALDFAKSAEACFWQATGESDCFDLEIKKL